VRRGVAIVRCSRVMQFVSPDTVERNARVRTGVVGVHRLRCRPTTHILPSAPRFTQCDNMRNNAHLRFSSALRAKPRTFAQSSAEVHSVPYSAVPCQSLLGAGNWIRGKEHVAPGDPGNLALGAGNWMTPAAAAVAAFMSHRAGTAVRSRYLGYNDESLL
jgi:hypothetical protein